MSELEIKSIPPLTEEDINLLGTPSFGMNKIYFNDIIPTKDWHIKNTMPNYKYNEDNYIRELSTYINKTYSEHYSQNKFQATEFIIDSGHGTGFCMGNVMKYAQRYGKKGSRDDWRKDLIKVIHYAMMQLHVHDNEGSK